MNKSRGFTLVEILVVIGIIAVLAALLFPVFSQAKHRARNVTCISNIEQLGQACEMYMADHDGNLPAMPPYVVASKHELVNPLSRYSDAGDLLHCPEYSPQPPATDFEPGLRIDYQARYALMCADLRQFLVAFRVVPNDNFVLAYCPWHGVIGGRSDAYYNVVRIGGGVQRIPAKQVKSHTEDWGGFGPDIQPDGYHWLEFPGEQFPPTVIREE